MQTGSRVDWRFVVLATLILTCLVTIATMGWGETTPFGIVHHRQMITWGVWLALAPVIILVARRSPFGEGSPIRWLGRHLLYGATFSLVSIAIIALLRTVFGGSVAAAVGPVTAATVAPTVAADLLRYSLIAVSYQAVTYHRMARAREAQAARLRVDLAEAKLANLEGKLHPHFLFNTLNSIAALVREDPRSAETMIEQLGELLRASLETNPLRMVPLDEELRLTEQYLAIQRVRFQERLRTAIEASQAARHAQVPPLLLQPLVENAIRHGISPRESGGSVTVSAAVEDESLVITVEDDGVGIGAAPTERAGGGLGLRSVRSRLSHLYGDGHRYEVTARSPSGTRIMIRIPYRTAVA
jgi:two-component system LytT family sensor kinase